MRPIKNIHQAYYSPIADLITYSPLPSRSLQQIDPFLFLNHHGPQQYAPNNNGLPFGPHPHRGMETVTFILEGDIMHKDSGGHESIIAAGGVQWMTAGSGLIHAEVSSDRFKKEGGKLEILQLWLNLPSYLKMIKPQYSGFQKNEVPVVKISEDVTVNVVSGKWGDIEGAFSTETEVNLSTVYFKKGGQLSLDIPAERNVFFYIIAGRLVVNTIEVNALHLVEFSNQDSAIVINALEDSVLLLGDAKPINESVVAQGPFVMNTEEEITQAYNDYRMGKFGTWK
ncbi:MAG: pirin family protein [Sphingobacteriaceae bacterium]